MAKETRRQYLERRVAEAQALGRSVPVTIPKGSISKETLTQLDDAINKVLYPTGQYGDTTPLPSQTPTQTYTGPTKAELQEMARQEKLENLQSAAAGFTSLLQGYGFTSAQAEELKKIVDESVKNLDATATTLNKARMSNVYNQRFTGMKALRDAGQAIDEATYISMERALKNVMVSNNLPEGFYDSYDDFGGFISKGVSATELEERITAGQDRLNNAPAEVKTQLMNFYGVDEGGALAYVLDPTRAQSVIKRQVRAAEIGAAAQRAQFAVTEQEAQRLQSYITETETYASLANRFQTAQEIQQNQQKLAAIEGTQLAEDIGIKAVIEQETGTLLESQKRAEREKARFRGATGTTQVSLAQGTAGQF